jgi:GT2 family glycosyltransferase
MDEGYFLYAEEMDLCYRLGRRDWEIWHQPLARAMHEGGGSGAPRGYRSGEILYASQMRFFELHYGLAAAAVLKLETYAAIVVQQWWRALCRLASRGRYAQRGLSLRRVAALRRGWGEG